MTYNMNIKEVTLSKLQGPLRTAESNLKDKSVASTPTTIAPVLDIEQGKGKKRKAPSKSHHKGKSQDGTSAGRTKVCPVAPSSNPKDA